MFSMTFGVNEDSRTHVYISLQRWEVEWICVPWISVSQPPDRGPVPGPGIHYTGPREAWGNYNMLKDLISPVIGN